MSSWRDNSKHNCMLLMLRRTYKTYKGGTILQNRCLPIKHVKSQAGVEEEEADGEEAGGVDSSVEQCC